MKYLQLLYFQTSKKIFLVQRKMRTPSHHYNCVHQNWYWSNNSISNILVSNYTKKHQVYRKKWRLILRSKFNCRVVEKSLHCFLIWEVCPTATWSTFNMQLLDSQDRHTQCYPLTTNGKMFKDKQSKGMQTENPSFLRDTIFIDILYLLIFSH